MRTQELEEIKNKLRSQGLDPDFILGSSSSSSQQPAPTQQETESSATSSATRRVSPPKWYSNFLRLPFFLKFVASLIVLSVIGRSCQAITGLGQAPPPRYIGRGIRAVDKPAPSPEPEPEDDGPDRARQRQQEADQLFNRCSAARVAAQREVAEVGSKMLVERGLRWQQFAFSRCSSEPGCNNEFDWLLNLREIEASRLEALTPRGTLNLSDTSLATEYFERLRTILEMDQALSQAWASTPSKPVDLREVNAALQAVQRACRQYQNFLSMEDFERTRGSRSRQLQLDDPEPSDSD